MTATRPERLVMDASAVVAMLADIGPAGEWATEQATYTQLATPDLMPYEASNILRRHVLAGVLDASAAALAHTDLTALPFDLLPVHALHGRVWELRDNLTIYDPAYVALAELLGVPMVTLDARLASAGAPRCAITVYRDSV